MIYIQQLANFKYRQVIWADVSFLDDMATNDILDIWKMTEMVLDTLRNIIMVIGLDKYADGLNPIDY